MTDKNLLRRIERIEENLLANEPSNYKLSPEMQEAVDFIVRRGEPPLDDPRESENKVDQPHFQRQPDKFSSGLQDALQASLDRLIARTEKDQKERKGDEKNDQ